MELFLSLLIPISLLTYFIIKARERILCHRKYADLTHGLNSRVAEIRYLHPTDSEQNISNEYFARLYITEKGLIIIPEMPYILCPDIFLFVTARVNADSFPKPLYLCEINNIRTSENMNVITSTVRHIFNTNHFFEMIIESSKDITLAADLNNFCKETSY
jgi:hypothetical protein